MHISSAPYHGFTHPFCAGFHSHRYGFQGQEEDDEIKGEGNSQDFGARFHDPRLGRFFSVDNYAREFAYQSPYSSSGNMPILAKDVNGDSVWVYSNTIDKSYGIGRHMFIRVKSGDTDVLIEMSGPANGHKVGQVKVSDWTDGQLTGRSNVKFHQVYEPIDTKNPEKFEENIIKYAKYFESNNVYDKNKKVASNSLLPNYEKYSRNSNGFARSLIEYAGGNVDFEVSYATMTGPEVLPGALWNNLEVYFEPLRKKYGRDEFMLNTYGMTTAQYNRAMNSTPIKIEQKSDPKIPQDNTYVAPSQKGVVNNVTVKPAELSKKKSGTSKI